MGLEDAGKLADAEIESYGMFLRVRGKYLIICRSKATDEKDDWCIRRYISMSDYNLTELEFYEDLNLENE